MKKENPVLATTPITHASLIDLFYQIELNLEHARKRRSATQSIHALKDSMRAITNILNERRQAIDLALTHRFDARTLMDEAHIRFLAIQDALR
jgi:hypothetical protein